MPGVGRCPKQPGGLYGSTVLRRRQAGAARAPALRAARDAGQREAVKACGIAAARLASLGLTVPVD